MPTLSASTLHFFSSRTLRRSFFTDPRAQEAHSRRLRWTPPWRLRWPPPTSHLRDIPATSISPKGSEKTELKTLKKKNSNDVLLSSKSLRCALAIDQRPTTIDHRKFCFLQISRGRPVPLMSLPEHPHHQATSPQSPESDNITSSPRSAYTLSPLSTPRDRISILCLDFLFE